MSKDEFMRAMGDVTPIKREKRVSVSSNKISGESLAARRRSAVEEGIVDDDTLSGEFVERLNPQDILDFKRSGIQNGAYRNFRLGKYEIQARLDLHHHSVEQARRAVSAFVRDCLQYEVRCGLITHGKGEGREQQATLKSCIAHWLPQFEDVVAFHSAQKHHGGAGATYVMIRKNSSKKNTQGETT